MKLKLTQLQQKPRSKRWSLRLGTPARIALVLVFVVSVSLMKDIYWQIRLSHQQQINQVELNTLNERFETLTEQRERLRTDEDYVEGLIRSTFKYARPGELVVPLDEKTPELITVSLTED